MKKTIISLSVLVAMTSLGAAVSFAAPAKNHAAKAGKTADRSKGLSTVKVYEDKKGSRSIRVNGREIARVEPTSDGKKVVTTHSRATTNALLAKVPADQAIAVTLKDASESDKNTLKNKGKKNNVKVIKEGKDVTVSGEAKDVHKTLLSVAGPSAAPAGSGPSPALAAGLFGALLGGGGSTTDNTTDTTNETAANVRVGQVEVAANGGTNVSDGGTDVHGTGTAYEAPVSYADGDGEVIEGSITNYNGNVHYGTDVYNKVTSVVEDPNQPTPFQGGMGIPRNPAFQYGDVPIVGGAGQLFDRIDG